MPHLPASALPDATRLLVPSATTPAAATTCGFRRRLLAGGIALLALTAGAAPVWAIGLVVPGGFASTEADSSYAFIDLAPITGITYQQEYDFSLLTGLATGDVLTGLQFRLDGGETTGPASSVIVTNFDVYLGPSVNAAGALSASVAANQGAGTVLAFTGSLTIPANSFTGGPGPASNNFGLQIVFTTPFTYTAGTNLLLTLSYTNPITDLYFDYASSVAGVQARSDATYNSPGMINTASVPTDHGNKAIVTQFTYTAAPEPASTGLLLGGAALLGLRRQRQG